MNTNLISKESITKFDNSHMLQIVSVDFGFKLNELEDVLASRCSRSRLTLRRKIQCNKAKNGVIQAKGNLSVWLQRVSLDSASCWTDSALPKEGSCQCTYCEG